jgi:hypothetical protein
MVSVLRAPNKANDNLLRLLQGQAGRQESAHRRQTGLDTVGEQERVVLLALDRVCLGGGELVGQQIVQRDRLQAGPEGGCRGGCAGVAEGPGGQGSPVGQRDAVGCAIYASITRDRNTGSAGRRPIDAQPGEAAVVLVDIDAQFGVGLPGNTQRHKVARLPFGHGKVVGLTAYAHIGPPTLIEGILQACVQRRAAGGAPACKARGLPTGIEAPGQSVTFSARHSRGTTSRAGPRRTLRLTDWCCW